MTLKLYCCSSSEKFPLPLSLVFHENGPGNKVDIISMYELKIDREVRREEVKKAKVKWSYFADSN